DTHNMSALNWAAISGSEPITRLLMNRLHDINSSDSQFRTSLFMAAEYGRTDVARALLEHDSVQVNKANVEKQTPLFIAAKKGRTEIVKMLLAREDVYINSRDLEGRSPLWIAAYE
ncbi:ankyrin repeat-containing domain protein, partial [Cercophora newfieldiana]